MTVQLSWNPPRHDKQNGAIVYYIVNITATHPRMVESFQQNCAMVSCNITHLYQFIVSAVAIGPRPYIYSEVYNLEAGKL